LIAGGEARVNDVWMPRGATVFTGDEVTAGDTSTVLQLSNGGKVELYPATRIRLADGGPAVRLALQSGQVAFYFPAGSTAEIVSVHGVVRLAEDGGRYLGSVATGPDQDRVEAVSGRLAVTNAATGLGATLEAGQAANVLGSPQTQTAVTGKGRQRDKSCQVEKDLAILYTTDPVSVPLSQRAWTPVPELVNGYQERELLDAWQVNADGTVERENHVSGLPDSDGWASLTFAPVEATGVAIQFENAEPGRPNAYHVNEYEAYLDEVKIERVRAVAWPKENRKQGARPRNSVDGEIDTATWSVEPNNQTTGYLALDFGLARTVNRIRLWKDCCDVAALYWIKTPWYKNGIVIAALIGGGTATGIILYNVIKEDEEASPSRP
ncbi:MAG: hypothetical protein JXQ27_04875, partial [Acidobacteria bacterium]|nr:hypothetical protein [Acidobacteriota bacterium]